MPMLGWRLGPGNFELGGHLQLGGKNLPAGPVLTLGYFFDWRL